MKEKLESLTLDQLREMASTGVVSKSGVNHRLRKIDEIAENLRGGELIQG